MKTIEFETELRGNRSLRVPNTVFDSLPTSGKAVVLVCVDLDPEDREWRKASYEQFLRDDSDEDAVYDKYERPGTSNFDYDISNARLHCF